MRINQSLMYANITNRSEKTSFVVPNNTYKILNGICKILPFFKGLKLNDSVYLL